MKDLTRGSITAHLISMAIPMAAGMIVQTLVSLALLRSQLRVRLAPLDRLLHAPQQA